MSKKLEQILDHLVNEDMDKANELFHEYVVEKSRTIYEDLINEEIETEAKEHDDKEVEEAHDESDESVEEAYDDQQDESMDDENESVEEDSQEMDEAEELEDSYVMDGDDEDEHGFANGDPADDLGAKVMAGDDMPNMGDDDEEGSEDEAIADLEAALADLEAAFAELKQVQGKPGDGGIGDMDKMGSNMDDMDDEEPMMGKPAMEGKRLTREYVEKVGYDWDSSSKAKAQGKPAGAGTGEDMGTPAEGKSPVSSAKGRPTTGADAKNIAQAGKGENQDGTKPHGKAGGFLSAAKDMKTGNGNVPGGNMGVKHLSKVAKGHGAEKKGSGPGPVGAGTGDKAGQTSVGNEKSIIGSKKL